MRRLACLMALCAAPALAGDPQPTNPILFVAAYPVHADFATIGSTFANHLPRVTTAGRGSDLMIRYPNGSLRNLTQEAGFGSTGVWVAPGGWTGPNPPAGFQDANAIAVRDPAVHWNGQKAVFSMVIGAAAVRYQVVTNYWQLYEVTNLGQGQGPAVITKVPNQPLNANNIMPAYLSDGTLVFASDRPRNGAAHLYPQLDEYESTPTPTGLWRLNPANGQLTLLDHSPSGSFTPIVDSFGRIVFTRWDHLQRDQQGDDPGSNPYGAFDYSSEAANATALAQRVEIFPEPRPGLEPPGVNGLRFNHFFPWTMTQDGRDLEVLQHLGRHELHSYFTQSFTGDNGLTEFISPENRQNIENMFQIAEDPLVAGRYVGVEAPEFATHAAGQLIAMVAGPSVNPDTIVVDYLTHPATGSTAPGPDNVGHFRDPLPMTSGALVAAHTFVQGEADVPCGGGGGEPDCYAFRLRTVVPGSPYMAPGVPLTGGIVRQISFWSPDELIEFSGEMWELHPVEVVARTVPPVPTPAIPAPELAAFAAASVDPATLESWMEANDLALVVSRNVTTRDDADRQQPFNLKVTHSTTQTVGNGGSPLYDVSYMQFIQGDQIRGYGGTANPNPGRRVLARELHDPAAIAANGPTTGPAGSVLLGDDGSMAAFLPAHRATTWQLTGPANQAFAPVVRERYWLSFQPGEVRVCASCHGVNVDDQAGQAPPANPPAALVTLLQQWAATGYVFADGFEAGNTSAWSNAVP